MTTITERIDATTRIPPQFLRADPPAPRSVKIEISPRCNYRCGFCALRTREKQPKWRSEPFLRLREAHLRKDVSETVCERCVACSWMSGLFS